MVSEATTSSGDIADVAEDASTRRFVPMRNVTFNGLDHCIFKCCLAHSMCFFHGYRLEGWHVTAIG